ncbi:MAG: hypothetical protein NW200_13735 [Hyphomonadaceae bacterium]|nr:hypothetical protein [Hyphomonadaceae bacterium]
MRRWVIAAAIGAALSGCGPAPAPVDAPASSEMPAVVEPAPPRPAPLSLERTAACAAALDVFKGFGKATPPAGVTNEQFGDAALITLRAVEIESTDAGSYKAAFETARAAWSDQTPADIEGAVAACLREIRG